MRGARLNRMGAQALRGVANGDVHFGRARALSLSLPLTLYFSRFLSPSVDVFRLVLVSVVELSLALFAVGLFKAAEAARAAAEVVYVGAREGGLGAHRAAVQRHERLAWSPRQQTTANRSAKK